METRTDIGQSATAGRSRVHRCTERPCVRDFCAGRVQVSTALSLRAQATHLAGLKAGPSTLGARLASGTKPMTHERAHRKGKQTTMHQGGRRKQMTARGRLSLQLGEEGPTHLLSADLPPICLRVRGYTSA